MHKPYATLLAAVGCAGLVGACSGDSGTLGSSLTTSSVSGANGPTQTATPKIDPACVALVARIDALRRDGVTERVEKAATGGKSTNVSVKRSSLAQMADLDKANAEFQAKCSSSGLRPMTSTQTSSIPSTSATGMSSTAAATPTAKVATTSPTSGTTSSTTSTTAAAKPTTAPSGAVVAPVVTTTSSTPTP